MAHWLELSISDAVKSVTATNHFQAFIFSIHALYSHSPKNQRELALAAAGTETVLLQIKGIFTVRWVASSLRSVRAIWRDFQLRLIILIELHLTAHVQHLKERNLLA
jgi:hypothetical protein